MKFSYRSALFFMIGIGAFFSNTPYACAKELTAYDVYNQAKSQNEKFFNFLSRYSNSVNIETQQGDTAYCLALNDDNKDAIKLLKKYGADTKHKCTEKLSNKQKKLKKENKRVAISKRGSSTRFRADNDNASYLLWGGVGLAAGGTALASAGGGGGSGSNTGSGNSDFNKPFDVVYKGDGTASGFETKEYKEGNFLDKINASKAYAHMYSAQEGGTVVSHQANSDDPLKKVKVGVIDTGIANNNEFIYGLEHIMN